MTTTDRVAHATWQTATDHADECGWHPALYEFDETGRVTTSWSHPSSWPGGDPAVLLGDWMVHPTTRWLVLTSPCTIRTGDGREARGRMVVCLERDARWPVVLAGGTTKTDRPGRQDTLGGQLIDTMRATFGATRET